MPLPKPPLQVPAAFGHWFVQGGRLECRLPRRTVTVRAPGKLLRQVQTLCDGTLTWPAVVERLGQTWSAAHVADFLTHLAQNQVLVEASQQWAHWSELAQLPSATVVADQPEDIDRLHERAKRRLRPGEGIWHPDVAAGRTRLGSVLAQRESVRTFDDQPVSFEVLCSVLWAAHGVTRQVEGMPRIWRRTAASGGDMHSARWYVAVLRELPAQTAGRPAQAAGFYEAQFHRDGGASLKRIPGAAQDAWRCLNDPRVLRFASALLLPVYDVGHPGRKYGNRATLFATIEAGQCLQNAQLMAAELDAGSTLRGDTLAATVIDLLGLRQEAGPAFWMSMPAMVLGAKPSRQQKDLQRGENWLKLAPNSALAEGDAASLFAFGAKPAAPRGTVPYGSSGRASKPELAVTKAEAEAWERRGWAEPQDLVEARIGELSSALHPSELVAYSARQYASHGFRFHPFSPRRRYFWKEAVDVGSGEECFVLACCVHPLMGLPLSHRRRAYTGSSTSGVAAGVTQQEALFRACLELLERDAFVCAWVSGRAPAAIDPASLPWTATRRIADLQSAGVRVVVQDLSTRWACVISVFLQDERLPFTTITAGAHLVAEQALMRALEEAEGRLAHARAFAPPPPNSPSLIQRIERYYRQARHLRRSDFYVEGAAAIRFRQVAREVPASWEQLQSRIRADGARLLCADLTPPQSAIEQGRRPLHVARALIPGLVPIWFSPATQPEGMPRFAAAARTAGGRPRGFYAHPFT